MYNGGINPAFSRIGGKSLLKKKIVDEYFPKDYEDMIYVEPFIGGGSIFFYKEPSVKEVVNDKDKLIISLLRGFKEFDGDKISKDINGTYDKDKFNKILESKPRTEYNKFIRNLILKRVSFFGDSSSFGGETSISSNFGSKYNDRLKDVTVKNEDYKTIIKQYDSPDTFFYLDPLVGSQTRTKKELLISNY